MDNRPLRTETQGQQATAIVDLEPEVTGAGAEPASPVDPVTTRQLKPPVGLVLGALFGLIASVFYTTSNIALRYSVGVDPFLVTAIKAYPMVIMLAPAVLWMWLRGQPLLTSVKHLPRFIAASFLAHFVGNACFQFSLEMIGLAATVPITLGTLIVGGAVAGRIILLEPVRPRTFGSMMVIIAAIVVLSMPGAAVPTDPDLVASSTLFIGAAWAIGAGLSYGMFGVITRQTLNGGLSIPLTMLISGSVGVISLTPFTLYRLGWVPLTQVTGDQWLVMFAAGFFNFTAFVALTISLKALPVVAVNLLNATQVAMAAIAAVLLFSERLTPPIMIGIGLTLLGLLILSNPQRMRRPAA